MTATPAMVARVARAIEELICPGIEAADKAALEAAGLVQAISGDGGLTVT